MISLSVLLDSRKLVEALRGQQFDSEIVDGEVAKALEVLPQFRMQDVGSHIIENFSNALFDFQSAGDHVCGVIVGCAFRNLRHDLEIARARVGFPCVDQGGIEKREETEASVPRALLHWLAQQFGECCICLPADEDLVTQARRKQRFKQQEHATSVASSAVGDALIAATRQLALRDVAQSWKVSSAMRNRRRCCCRSAPVAPLAVWSAVMIV